MLDHAVELVFVKCIHFVARLQWVSVVRSKIREEAGQLSIDLVSRLESVENYMISHIRMKNHFLVYLVGPVDLVLRIAPQTSISAHRIVVEP